MSPATAARRSSRFRWPLVARHAALVFVTATAATVARPSRSTAQLARALPTSLTDREFWDFFTTMSEDGGSFPSENFVSNEQTYQFLIPTLQRTLTPGGVYLGVGPEQNFTYIANLKPRMAVIFDIRRQNAMAHLMYKALFELSPTRADFVSHLFSRPLPASINASTKPVDLFAAALAAKTSDSAFDANRQAILDVLMIKHKFALSPADVQSIRHVYASFFEAGPDINYAYRPDAPTLFRQTYATYAQIQNMTNASGVNMAFLATEENYQWLRGLHMKNLVIPVVGDFAGQKAIRSVGEYLKQRKATVTAFYLSNVEQYLFRQVGLAEQFYHNVETLPIDSTSTFIRSVPPDNGFLGGVTSIIGTASANGVGLNKFYSVQVHDSAGVSIIQTTSNDSAGQPVTTRTIDSSSGHRQSALEIFRALRMRDDSLLRARADSLGRVTLLGSPPVGSMITFPGAPAANGGVIASGRVVFIPDSTKTPLRDTAPPIYRVSPPLVVGNAGVLVSGIAPIRKSLEAFMNGQLSTYAQAIATTKIDGWK
jgi:hypothetical protein